MESRSESADSVRRAFAILGLRPGASLPDVRRRYRFLAQRWHPDRHANDARNQAEAATEMRRINEAYGVIVAARVASAPPVTRVSPSGRLSPQEIDALSRAIGADGPVDWALGSIGWVGSAIEGVVGVLGAVWLVFRLFTELPKGNFSVFRDFPELVLVLPLLVVLAFRELTTRSRLGDPTYRNPNP